MADSKLTALTELTQTSGSNILYIVDDPGGTPVGKKIQVANLLLREGARVYNSGNISTTTGADTPLTFDSERYDIGNLHSTSGSSGNFIVSIAGVYLMGGTVDFAGNGTGNRQLWITYRTTTDIGRVISNNLGSSQIVRMNIVVAYKLEAGDWVGMHVFQSSGGDLNVIAALQRSPEFWIQRVG